MPDDPNTPLTTKIKIKDKQGNVIREKEVATYAGLLSRAHAEGLCEISTSIVQIPIDENGFVCIAKAVVKTKKGVFSGIGDASPRNVTKMIVPHLIRMAETRAKARALRDAVNIGLVALEELGDDIGEGMNHPDEYSNRSHSSGNGHGNSNGNGHGNGNGAAHNGGNGHSWNGGSQCNGEPMTDTQRRFIYRLLSENGIEADAATTVIIEECGANSIASVSKQEASWLIERFRTRGGQEARHGN